MSYHAGPPTLVPLFGVKQSARVPRLFGIELEVAAPQSDSRMTDGLAAYAATAHTSGIWAATSDGSINGTGHGIEFVSRPMTLVAWREHRDTFTRFADAMARAGWRGHQAKSCGLHIHIARAAFRDDLHAMRFCQFFQEHAAQWTTLSRRRPDDLAQWAAFDRLSSADLRRKGSKSDTFSGCSRYTAINARNAATLELRFFRSTLKSGTFFGSLELAAAAVQVTRYAWRCAPAAQWAEFCHILSPKKFPDAAELVRRANLWAERPAPVRTVDATVSPFESDLMNPLAYDDALDDGATDDDTCPECDRHADNCRCNVCDNCGNHVDDCSCDCSDE